MRNRGSTETAYWIQEVRHRQPNLPDQVAQIKAYYYDKVPDFFERVRSHFQLVDPITLPYDAIRWMARDYLPDNEPVNLQTAYGKTCIRLSRSIYGGAGDSEAVVAEPVSAPDDQSDAQFSSRRKSCRMM